MANLMQIEDRALRARNIYTMRPRPGAKVELRARLFAPWLDPVPWHEHPHGPGSSQVGVKFSRNLTDFVETIAQC